MKYLLLLAGTVTLAACGEPSAEPTPVATQAAVEPTEPRLPAPDQDIFAATFAAACPEAEPISTSSCRSKGLGSDEFVCEYGFGEYLRHDATLVPGDGEWTVADPAETCAQGAD